MQRHLDACSRCSRQDTAIRRSLMLVRNLPPIEPSPEFMARLNARLERRRAAVARSISSRHVRTCRPLAPLQRSPPESSRLRTWRSRRRITSRRRSMPASCRVAASASELDAEPRWRTPLRRVSADGDAGVAGGADGRRGADALRERWISTSIDALNEQQVAIGRRRPTQPTFLMTGRRRARDRILLAMSPAADAKALRAAIKDLVVRAGVLFLRRRRLSQERRAQSR